MAANQQIGGTRFRLSIGSNYRRLCSFITVLRSAMQGVAGLRHRI
jgi:hypothetical protein